MAIPGVTVLLGAFLLFQVQLLLGKHILPWFGGAPAVWTTCMLFFQVVLLAGYAYAHWLVLHVPPRAQPLGHLALVAAAVALLGALALGWGSPVLPGPDWKPDAEQVPLWHIVRLLGVSVGLPFFVLSATGPLIQAWFAAARPTASPYRLYALSNLGSLLGLVTYPFVVEVWLSLRAQAWLWAAGFALFALGMAACASGLRASGADRAEPGTDDGARPTAPLRVLWFALAGCASVLLLATTNQMSQEIAAVPFLWMLPLCLYLLSFILCFDADRWYRRGVFVTLFVLGLSLSALVMERGVFAPIAVQIAVQGLTLFAACMVCHGELVRLRPPARHLTSFYLTITASGAAGGLFVAVAAPALFPGLWEYPIGLWGTAVLLVIALWRDRASPLGRRAAGPAGATFVASALVTAYLLRGWVAPELPEPPDRWLFGAPIGVALGAIVLHHLGGRRRAGAGAAGPAARWRGPVARGAAVGALLLLAAALVVLTRRPLVGAVYQARNFYGVLKVIEDRADEPEEHRFQLVHGRIVHGVQYQAEERRGVATAYYGEGSGIALALEHHPRRAGGLRIGVIGLGAGTLAAWAQPEDTLRFYEINPDVLRLAGPGARTFTYLRDNPARTEVVLGDARLALERELTRGPQPRYDILAVDAFSSDAIPAHLLTREAVAVYLQRLDADGILAVHISNRYLDLEPVIRGLARRFGLAHVFVASADGELTWRSTWALLARDQRLLAIAAIAEAAAHEDAGAPAILWTDDYSNLARVLKRR